MKANFKQHIDKKWQKDASIFLGMILCDNLYCSLQGGINREVTDFIRNSINLNSIRNTVHYKRMPGIIHTKYDSDSSNDFLVFTFSPRGFLRVIARIKAPHVRQPHGGDNLHFMFGVSDMQTWELQVLLANVDRKDIDRIRLPNDYSTHLLQLETVGGKVSLKTRRYNG